MSLLDMSLLVFFVAALIKILADFNVFMRETSGKTFRQELYEIFFDEKGVSNK